VVVGTEGEREREEFVWQRRIIDPFLRRRVCCLAPERRNVRDLPHANKACTKTIAAGVTRCKNKAAHYVRLLPG